MVGSYPYLQTLGQPKNFSLTKHTSFLDAAAMTLMAEAFTINTFYLLS
jgi:hypothetical protein